MAGAHAAPITVTPSPAGRPRGVRRAAIAFFFASVALNACLGIVALVMGDFGQTQGKVLGTSLCVTAAVMLALAATPAWERRLLGPVPAVGASSGAVGFALLIVAIWLGEDASPTLGKAVGTALTVGGAGSLASLLALPRLAPRHRHVLTTALALGAVAAAMVLVQIWGELDSSLYARALGVVAVLLGAVAVSIPVLHRIGDTAGADAAADVPRFCPFCGAELTVGRGRSATCGACGRSFSVRLGR